MCISGMFCHVTKCDEICYKIYPMKNMRFPMYFKKDAFKD